MTHRPYHCILLLDPLDPTAAACCAPTDLRPTTLRPQEAAVLLRLLSAPRETPVSHNQLLIAGWGHDVVEPGALYTAVSRLRTALVTALPPMAAAAPLILTHRSLGCSLSRDLIVYERQHPRPSAPPAPPLAT